jgi:hypothetical protein
MAPIFKLWQGRFTEAWHQLSQKEQTDLLGKVQQALEDVGGKELVLCSAAWSNERWPFFGVEEFPDLAAVERHTDALIDLRLGRYMDSRTSLGSAFVLPESSGDQP